MLLFPVSGLRTRCDPRLVGLRRRCKSEKLHLKKKKKKKIPDSLFLIQKLRSNQAKKLKQRPEQFRQNGIAAYFNSLQFSCKQLWTFYL